MQTGLFITLEGGEGSGKTTTSEVVKTRLEAMGYQVVLTREPGGVEVSEAIRNTIMNYELHKKTEILLFAAARVEHLHQKIIPALNANKIVLCDRYIDSSIVYQGMARNSDTNYVKDINYWATDEFLPDLTIFFDVKPEIALGRISEDEREVNRFDNEKLEFHNAIYEGYTKIANENKARIKKVDATAEQEQVIDAVMTLVTEQING